MDEELRAALRAFVKAAGQACLELSRDDRFLSQPLGPVNTLYWQINRSLIGAKGLLRAADEAPKEGS